MFLTTLPPACRQPRGSGSTSRPLLPPGPRVTGSPCPYRIRSVRNRLPTNQRSAPATSSQSQLTCTQP